MSSKSKVKIIDVYNINLANEIQRISYLIEKYPIIAMDTEFPGIVFPLTNSYLNISGGNLLNGTNKPPHHLTCESLANSESPYDTIKMNVDNLKMIQLGISLSNEHGEVPPEDSTWQFNFKFNLDEDTYLKESICLLEDAGIDFKKFHQEGIEINTFAEKCISSGLILNDKIKWITFHGIYDLAYLLKALTNQPLPDDEKTFLEDLNLYFPNFYDLRCLIKPMVWLKGSLNKIAKDLNIERIGQAHQAGSDSLLTSKIFFNIFRSYHEFIDLDVNRNILFGYEPKNYLEGNMTYNTNNSHSNENFNGNLGTNNLFGFYPNGVHKGNVYYNSYGALNPNNIVFANPTNFAGNGAYTIDYAYYPNPFYGVRK